VLGNTFHLMLRPGTDVIRAHGGLHGFHALGGPDPDRTPAVSRSSAWQNCAGSRGGGGFRSPVNGDPVFLSPRSRCGADELDSDVVMRSTSAAIPASEAEARQSMELSIALGAAQLRRFRRTRQPNALFGIVKAARTLALRLESLVALRESVRRLRGRPASRSAKPAAEAQRRARRTRAHLPQDRPRT